MKNRLISLGCIALGVLSFFVSCSDYQEGADYRYSNGALTTGSSLNSSSTQGMHMVGSILIFVGSLVLLMPLKKNRFTLFVWGLGCLTAGVLSIVIGWPIGTDILTVHMLGFFFALFGLLLLFRPLTKSEVTGLLGGLAGLTAGVLSFVTGWPTRTDTGVIHMLGGIFVLYGALLIIPVVHFRLRKGRIKARAS